MPEHQPDVYDPNSNPHWVAIRQYIEKHGGVPGTLYDAARSQRGPVATIEPHGVQADADTQASLE